MTVNLNYLIQQGKGLIVDKIFYYTYNLYIFSKYLFCLGESTSYILDVALKARERALGPLHPSFNVVKYLRDGLNAFLPPNAHELASGRLFISLTRVSDQQNVLVNQFETKEDLIQVSSN